MKLPTTKFVFDRKHVSTSSKSKDARKASVMIEVYYERKKKFITTGILVFKDQWSDSSHIKNRTDSVQLNKAIEGQMRMVLSIIDDVVSKNGSFSFSTFESMLNEKKESSVTFIEFIENKIEERADIRDSTKGRHESALRELKRFGKIRNFSDLTVSNIMKFDDYLHRKTVSCGNGEVKNLSQVTIYSIHKKLRSYVNMAVSLGYIDKSPYDSIHIEAGRPAGKKYLTESELDMIRTCSLPEKLEKVRDVFLFQCYTALSYSDMAKFDFERDAVKIDGRYKIIDRRVKTDEDYYIVILEPAMEILRKYDFVLPVISNQKMNEYLKLVAIAAGIDKPITSHYGRHTFCVAAFNNGISPDVIARMMGHSSSKVTLESYARLVTKTIDEGYESLEKVLTRNS